MADLPKIAQARLRRQQTAAASGIHPNANVLTAFVEGAMGEPERVNLLAHLSECADCREIVSLSLPEFVAGEAEKPAASPIVWYRNLGVLKWGTVAASIVVVAGAVLLMNPKQATELRNISRVSSDRATESKPASPQQSAPAAHPEPSTEADSGRARANEPKSEKLNDAAAEQKKSESDSKKQSTTGFVRSPVVPSSKPEDLALQGRNSYQLQPLDKAASGSAGQSAAKLPTSTSGTPQRQDFDSSTTDAKNAKNKPPAPAGAQSGSAIGGGISAGIAGGIGSAGYADSRLGKTDTFSAASTRGAPLEKPVAPPAPSPPASTSPSTEKAPSAQQRSAAKAKDENSRVSEVATQTVEVSAEAAPIQLNAVTATTGWHITNGKLFTNRDGSGRWQEVTFASKPQFSKLATQANDIWVGGAKGVLYHSPDGGKTWSLVTGGWSQESEVTYLAFRDSQHGELRTSMKDRWTTSDAGRTWQKQ